MSNQDLEELKKKIAQRSHGNIKFFGEHHLRSGNHRKNKLTHKKRSKQCL